MAEVTALRNNALPYPVYGAPYTVVFPLLDADGDPVTGATCDSEISKNGDTAVDCTNEGTEIPFTTATNKGIYYLTLTAAEMTADIVAITIYSATSKATPIVLYPRKLVTLTSGTSQSSSASVAYIKLATGVVAVDNQYNGCLCVATIDGNVEARVLQVCTSSNDQCTVTPEWNVSPDADDTYVIYLPEGMQVNQADVRSLQTSSPAVGNIVSILLNTGTTDDVDISVRSLNITNDSGAGLFISGSTKDVQLGGSGTIETTAGKPVPTSLAAILGTAVTETTPGYLAASFVKLHNVATPLLTTSAVMRGTDGANTTVPDAAGTAATLLGANGASLSAIPWNSAWDTEVQSECNDALVAMNLDHLMAARKTWFVATTGSDSNSGLDPTDAFLTPEYAIQTAASAGDTIILGVGTFGEHVINNMGVAVDNGNGLVGIPITAHRFSSGDEVVIDGTTNYDGTETLHATTSANELVIDKGQATLNVGSAVNKGGGLVGIPATSHGFSAGVSVDISGTEYYDGTEVLHADTSTHELVITADFNPETFSDTDTATATFQGETFSNTDTVTQTRTITMKDGQTLQGVGAGSTIIKGASTNFASPVVNISSVASPTILDLSIINVQAGGMALWGDSPTACLIDRCIIDGPLDGARLDGCDRAVIRNSYIHSVYDALITNGADVVVDNCHIISDGIGGTGSEPAAFRTSLGAQTTPICSVTLKDCFILTNRTTAEDHFASVVEADRDARVTVINCHIRGESTHVDDDGDVYGIRAKQTSRIIKQGGSIWTGSASEGNGEAKDLKKEDTAQILIDEAAVLYDSTSVEGTITTPIPTQLDAILENTGIGARTVTVTVDDGATPLENATVRFTESVNTYTGSTNASGVIVFSLDDATYTVSISKAGYTFTPTTKIVNGTETDTYSMSAVTITAPPNAATTTGVMTVYDEEGTVESGVTITVQVLDGPGTAGIGYDSTEWEATSNGSGVVEFAGIILGARYKIWRGTSKPDAQTFTAPTTGTSFNLAEVIGRG